MKLDFVEITPVLIKEIFFELLKDKTIDRTLMNHVANSYNIEMAVGFAALFCPEIIEVDGCIFIGSITNFVG